MSQKSCRAAESPRVMNKADTCRKHVVPKLTESSWDDEPPSHCRTALFHGWPYRCRWQQGQTKAILDELLEKYAEHGTAQVVLPDVLEVPPISAHGNVMEIAGLFGGPDKLREAVNRLQTLLYAA